ncbi:hypothetical protein ACET3Z_013248 [Daucus carota]
MIGWMNGVKIVLLGIVEVNDAVVVVADGVVQVVEFARVEVLVVAVAVVVEVEVEEPLEVDKKQHDKARIETRNLCVLFNRSVPKRSQLGKNGLKNKLSKFDPTIINNAEPNLLKQRGDYIKVLASGRSKHFSQSVEEEIPLRLQIAFQHSRQIDLSLI